MEWIKVTDRLPALNDVVIGYGKDIDGAKVRDFCSVTTKGFKMQNKVNRRVKITHWTPLLEPPQE